MLLFKKLAVQLEWRMQAKKVAKSLLKQYLMRNGKYIVIHEDCSDDDKRFIRIYDEILYELTAIRLYDYNRFKKVFVKYLLSTEKFQVEVEAARELLENEFEADKDAIEKLLIKRKFQW